MTRVAASPRTDWGKRVRVNHAVGSSGGNRRRFVATFESGYTRGERGDDDNDG